MKKIVLIFVVIFLLVIAGYVILHSHQSEINEADSYIESANSRLIFPTDVDFTKVSVWTIKANASAAKSDLTEASNILNKIPLKDLNDKDKADLKALIVIVNFNMKLCDLSMGPLSDFIENFQTYSDTQDPNTAAISINSMKKDLNDIDSSLNSMSGEINNVNQNDLSPKARADFVYFKSMVLSIQDGIRKIKNKLENACTVKCNIGDVLGTDCQCHSACGSGYCGNSDECCNGQCYLTCSIGYVRGSDCQCHAQCGGSYCSSDATCCGGKCYTCTAGSVMGTDCKCHVPCGNVLCSSDTTCCGGQCYLTCSAGYVRGSDCQCHAQCGGSYCSSDATCCGGICRTCASGLVMGTDCRCHVPCGNGFCSSDATCCGGQCYSSCRLGYVLGNDCICHTP